MFLIILGIIVFLVSFQIKRLDQPFPKYTSTVRTTGIVLFIAGFLVASIKQIDAGQVGVKSLFGKVQNDVLTSGLNFINPLMDVYTVDVKTQNYTMSGVHDEGEKSGG